MLDGVVLLRFGLAAILYTFLGLAFYVMWQSLRQNAQRPPTQPTPAQLIMEVTAGEETIIPLMPVSTVGRDSNNILQLDDQFASAHHVMLMWRDNAWWVEDMTSHNGTYLNQTQITQATLLTFGDQIRVGETTLRFETETLSAKLDPPSRN